MEKEFNILTIKSVVRENYIYLNVVFKVYDKDYKRKIDSLSQEYVRSSVWVVNDPKEIEQYYDNIIFDRIPENGWYKSRSLFKKKTVSGWSINDFKCLTYIPKFDVYRFREYVENNKITRAAIETLESLKLGEENSARFVDVATLTRCIRALDIFWD